MSYKKTSLEQLFHLIDPEQPCAFDTETLGLYAPIRVAQFYQARWETALLVENPDPYMLVALMGRFKDVEWVMHQSAYDLTTLQLLTGTRFVPTKFHDTLLSSRLALPHLESHSLDAVIKEVIGFDPYRKAQLDKKELQKADWKGELTEEQQLYAALDVYHLLEVYYKVKQEETSLSYQLDIGSLRYALDFQHNGMCVDERRISALRRENLLLLDDLAMPVNVNSPKQVKEFLGSADTRGLTLAKMAYFGDIKAHDVITARRALKINSFLKKFSTDDGRVYGKFRPGAKSGRFTCEKQNLQQIPGATKGCFRASEGYVLGFADFAQLELRTIAAIVGDHNLCNIFYRGIDAHGYVADQFFGANWGKSERTTTKTINFNGLYGGGTTMLQGILLTKAGQWHELEAIARLMRRWKNQFRQIAEWQQAGIRAHKRGELGSTPSGRQYKATLMTDYLNIQNQGMGADVAKLTLLYMKSDLAANHSRLVNFVHDSFITEIPDDPTIYKEVAKRKAEAMREAWFKMSQLCKVKDIPMPVEVCIGRNWGDIETTDEHLHSLEVV